MKIRLRHAATIVEAALSRMPAVVLLGPRQVGKTTLAHTIGAARRGRVVHLDLERATDRRRLADADAFLRREADKLVVVDEIHRAPDLFTALRPLIDERRAAGRRNGHFLLLGSASLDLMRQASETLAGRVAYVELGPIDVLEAGARPAVAVDRLWLRGGFPDSVLARGDGASLRWRRDFVRSYLERDVPMFAPRMPAETIARLWTMLAHAQGTTLNEARLASALGVSSPTVGRYVDLLADLLLVRRLRAWSGNVGKRLVRAPKLYVRDSGLLHALLGVESLHQLLGHPVVGLSWEGFAVENLIAAAGPDRTPYFYRTADGAEIDLVLERGGTVEMAIEVKRSTAPALSRGFFSAREILRPRECHLVHPGVEAWPVADGIEATPLAALMKRLRGPELGKLRRS